MNLFLWKIENYPITWFLLRSMKEPFRTLPFLFLLGFWAFFLSFFLKFSPMVFSPLYGRIAPRSVRADTPRFRSLRASAFWRAEQCILIYSGVLFGDFFFYLCWIFIFVFLVLTSRINLFIIRSITNYKEKT